MRGSPSSSSLVDMFNKTSDEMNRTMLRQMSEAKTKERQKQKREEEEANKTAQKLGILRVNKWYFFI